MTKEKRLDPPKRRTCVWTPIEEGSQVYIPDCPDGEGWFLEPGCDLYPFCQWCGGRIRVGVPSHD